MLTPDTPSIAVQEFENLININRILTRTGNRDAKKLYQIDLVYRRQLFSEYYNTNDELIDEIIALPKESRRDVCNDKKINPYIFRTLFDYTRYRQCYLIYNYLSPLFDFKGKNILDFGCMVSDYGFYFGMLGMNVTLCDIKEHALFAEYRLKRADINHTTVYAPANYSAITKQQDLAVFGEVLEHLRDPYPLIESCVTNKVSYIFTSCYPYGNDFYFSLPGHRIEAKEQAPACLDLLRKNYTEIDFVDKNRLWVKAG